jgi:hypothetical protein
LCTGFGPDAPRARNVSPGPAAGAWGLAIESERTNNVVHSDSWKIGWEDGETPMKLSRNIDDPAGGSEATIFYSDGNEHSWYYPAKGRAISTWVRGAGAPAGGVYAHFRHNSSDVHFREVTSTEWARLSFTEPEDVEDGIALETRAVPVGAAEITEPTSIVAFGAQVEPEVAYPSSYIPTKGAPITREAERLFTDAGDMLLPGGYLNVTMRVAPHFATMEQGAPEYNLLYIDPEHRLFMRREGKLSRVVLRIDDVEVKSRPVAFSREQELTIRAKSQAGAGVELTVSGATSGDGTTMGGEAGPLPTDKIIYILSKDSGAEECADLRSIRFQ